MSGTWAAADGPHRLGTTVTAGSLVIEAGALICAGDGAAIVAESIFAEGTPDRPIRFTAAVGASQWGGISARNVSLTWVILEHTSKGVESTSGGSVLVEHSTIRRVSGPALIVGDNATASIARTQLDSACLASCLHPSAPAAVVVRPDAAFTLHDSRITDSGAGGLYAAYRSRVGLRDVVIERSEGIGLELAEETGRTVALTEWQAVTITGGASYPARIPLAAAAMMLPSGAENLTGNALDTILATGFASSADSLVIRPGLAVAISGSPAGNCCALVKHLTLEPGAALTLHGPHEVAVEKLTSSGTADLPVRIAAAETGGAAPTGLVLLTAGGDTSRATHTWFDRTVVHVRIGHPAVFTDVRFGSAELRIDAIGTRVTRAAFNGARASAAAAMTISGAAVQVRECEVTGSQSHGILVTIATGVRINSCNIHGNAGAGVKNAAVVELDATGNWWGDAEGPFGANGDAVEGAVRFSPFLTTPVPFAGWISNARRS